MNRPGYRCQVKADCLLDGLKDAFRLMLDDVRKTRNKLMHFRADIDSHERDRLRFCAGWFKYHPPVLMAESSTAVFGIVPGPSAADESNSTVEDSAGNSLRDYTPTDPGDGKYAPLAKYLSAQSRSVDRLTLSFAEIQEIIGAELPPAARNHRAWWSNDATAHVQSAQWLDVNWRVVSINMTSERVVFARAKDRERSYITFFSTVQKKLRDIAGFPLVQASPLGQNWLPIGQYPGTGLTLVISFARRRRVRLECYIDTGDAVTSEALFNQLLAHRDVVETAVGSSLEWEQLEGRRACRLALYTPGTINDDPADLDRLSEWFVDHAPRLHRGLSEVISSVRLN